MIESRTTNYLNARFPILQLVYEFLYFIFLIIWIFGAIIGFYFLIKKPINGMLVWTIGWTTIGVLVFYLSFKWRIGTQRIFIDNNEIIISKKLLFLKQSRRIKFDKINKLEVQPFEPFNPLTGKKIKYKNELGWLKVNDDSLYYLNSYLYPEDQLQQIIKYWKSTSN